MSAKKRICVVGGGHWGKNHIKTLYNMGCLGGIVDLSLSRLSELHSLYPATNYYNRVEDSLINNYDGYTIATPAETHYTIGAQLLSEGKNVMIEKPFTLSVEEAERLVVLSKENNCKLMVGHLMLFHPAIQKIKQLVKSGRIGKIMYLYLSRLNYGRIRNNENVVYSFAAHDIAILNYLMDDLPLSVEAYGDDLFKRDIHDVVTAHFSYHNNVKAYLFVSWMAPFKEQNLFIVGEKGMLTFDNSSKENKIFLFDRFLNWNKDIPVMIEEEAEAIHIEPCEPLRNELVYFVNHFDSDITINDGQSALEVVKLLKKITDIIKERGNSE